MDEFDLGLNIDSLQFGPFFQETAPKEAETKEKHKEFLFNLLDTKKRTDMENVRG